MRGTYAGFLLLLGFLCTSITVSFGGSLRNSGVKCLDEERQALLEFKQGLEDNEDLLSSWGSEDDCCEWKGIKCSNQTGHVFMLHLGEGGLSLKGEMSSSLLGLRHLTYLNLSHNNFSQKPFPEFIGSLTQLEYLDLSQTEITGTIPQELGNLTHLISLNLSRNTLTEKHKLDWLLRLSCLRYLDMTRVNLSKAINWPDKISMLPSLKELCLSYCDLHMPISSLLSSGNSSSPLSFLDFSFNRLNSSLFPWLFKYSNSLVSLDLGHNWLKGVIPKAFGDMVALTYVDLSYNELHGMIPRTLGNLHNLQVLDLSDNNIWGEVHDLSKFPLLIKLNLSNNSLYGSLSIAMGKLFKLQVLDLSYNSLRGDITEAHFSNISSLQYLDLSFNFLSIKTSPTWVPSFHLDTIKLSSCKLGPKFPLWVQTQKNFSSLDISNAGISDTIPNWFWSLSSNIYSLDLSYNQIYGTIPSQWFSSRFVANSLVDLSSNLFSGPLPQFVSHVAELYLFNNSFQGSITSICEINKSINATYIKLRRLDLRKNLLSGELPNCWTNTPYLFDLYLGQNNLSGRIPNSIGRICDFTQSKYMLQVLALTDNNFIGEVPRSLMRCSSLRVLSLGRNRLSGKIPAWIGPNLSYLMVLDLSANWFTDSIPSSLCDLQFLHILDLSQNSITGTVPQCLSNMLGMRRSNASEISATSKIVTYNIPWNIGDRLVAFQENVLQPSNPNFYLVKALDLSTNKLEGEIPTAITSLTGLYYLNLSRNVLTGIIPNTMSDLQNLEALDLSMNHLSGRIPPNLASLNLLYILNLSYNNFSGKTPIGRQFDTFNSSSYEGNPNLCGQPLSRECLGDEAASGPQNGSKQEKTNIQDYASFYEHLWFYTSIALGYIAGFWGVCGTLVLKSSWRHAYFQFVDKIWDKLYVTIAISKVKLSRNFQTRC